MRATHGVLSARKQGVDRACRGGPSLGSPVPLQRQVLRRPKRARVALAYPWIWACGSPCGFAIYLLASHHDAKGCVWVFHAGKPPTPMPCSVATGGSLTASCVRGCCVRLSQLYGPADGCVERAVSVARAPWFFGVVRSGCVPRVCACVCVRMCVCVCAHSGGTCRDEHRWLSSAAPGTFLVRYSNGQKGSFVMSYVTTSRVVRSSLVYRFVVHVHYGLSCRCLRSDTHPHHLPHRGSGAKEGKYSADAGLKRAFDSLPELVLAYGNTLTHPFTEQALGADDRAARHRVSKYAPALLPQPLACSLSVPVSVSACVCYGGACTGWRWRGWHPNTRTAPHTAPCPVHQLPPCPSRQQLPPCLRADLPAACHPLPVAWLPTPPCTLASTHWCRAAHHTGMQTAARSRARVRARVWVWVRVWVRVWVQVQAGAAVWWLRASTRDWMAPGVPTALVVGLPPVSRHVAVCRPPASGLATTPCCTICPAPWSEPAPSTVVAAAAVPVPVAPAMHRRPPTATWQPRVRSSQMRPRCGRLQAWG